MMTSRGRAGARRRVSPPVQQRLFSQRIDRLSRQFPQATLYANGQFSLNDTWRWGFNITRASSADYIRDFHLGSRLGGEPKLLTSQIYAEGFGEGAYSRLDVRFYQALNDQVISSKLPWCCRATNTAISASRIRWVAASRRHRFLQRGAHRPAPTRARQPDGQLGRPFVGALGDLWKFTLHADAIAYNASHFNEQPNFGTASATVDAARALPQAALDFRWPFMRDSGAWGTQLIEPMAQIVVAPQAGDSQINKYPERGQPRLRIHRRQSVRLQPLPRRRPAGRRRACERGAAWRLVSRRHDLRRVDRPVLPHHEGQPVPGASGLHDQVSDVVARAELRADGLARSDLPHPARHRDLATRMADAIATVGVRSSRSRRLHLYHRQPVHFLRPAAAAASGQRLLLAAQRDDPRRLLGWGKYRFSGLRGATCSPTRWSPSAPTRSTRTNATSWISGSTAAIPRSMATTASTTAADPDDLQDDRPVRLQGALTTQDDHGHDPLRNRIRCAILPHCLLGGASSAAARRCATRRRPADCAGDAHRRGGERRRRSAMPMSTTAPGCSRCPPACR